VSPPMNSCRLRARRCRACVAQPSTRHRQRARVQRVGGFRRRHRRALVGGAARRRARVAGGRASHEAMRR
jgi:hypothetical protein